MEDARGKTCIDALVVEQLQKVFLFACAAAGNDGHVHPRRNCIQHLKVEAAAHAVGIDAVQADLARAVVHAPADPVQCIPAGVLAPALGEHPELAVHPLHIGREHHALVAVALCCRRDEVGIFECARVDADLVRAALEHPVKIFQRVDAAAHRERDKNFAGDAGQDIRKQRPALEAGGDIVEHQLVGTGSVVHAGHFHRVGHVPDAFKVRALDHAAIAHIKAGNNAFGDHVVSPPFTPVPAARSAQGPVRRCTGSCLKWQRQCPFFSVPEALLRTRCRRWP